MGQLHIIDHPLIQHKLTFMRDKDTNSKDFRELLEEISKLMGYEVLRGLSLKDAEVVTPIGPAKTKVLAGRSPAVVPILRAGLGMVSGIVDLLPTAKIGHIGLYRDPETLQPVEYYCKLPTDISEREIIVVDPMLATGGSAVAAIGFLKQHGGKRIRLMCLIGVPEGVRAVQAAHPDVDIYIAAMDEKLNEHAYIVPGLGDAGDRIFGTK